VSGTLRPGQQWGSETGDPPDFEVSGADAALAAVVARGVADPLVRFSAAPGSDLARAIGIVAGAAPGGLALPLDVLEVDIGEGGHRCAVNSVVIGVPPDRLRAWHRPAGLAVEIDGASVDAGGATSLVVMNGQYLRHFDVSPRGHPGDGIAEAQLYALSRAARRAMRARLLTGTHLPHPDVTTRKVRHATVRATRPVPVEIDGEPCGRCTTLSIALRPSGYRLLV
jgi:hypothetical protein